MTTIGMAFVDLVLGDPAAPKTDAAKALARTLLEWAEQNKGAALPPSIIAKFKNIDSNTGEINNEIADSRRLVDTQAA